jgi:chromosome segregation ATPase
LEAEVDRLQPSVIETTEAIQALKKRLTADEKAVARIKKEQETHAVKLSELQTEIEEYQTKETELQSEYDELKQSEDGIGSLTEEQEVRYEQIRDAAAVASAAPRRELQSAVRVLESARARAAKVAEEKNELIARKEEAERSVNELTQRTQKLGQVRFLT